MEERPRQRLVLDPPPPAPGGGAGSRAVFFGTLMFGVFGGDDFIYFQF